MGVSPSTLSFQRNPGLVIDTKSHSTSASDLTLIPDLFNGDAIPAEAHAAGTVDVQAWLKNHGTDVTECVYLEYNLVELYN